jgi:hypothetical protein
MSTKEGKTGLYDQIVGYITSLSIGFFTFPFVFFMVSTTLELIVSPRNIQEATAIIYVTLLVGFHYLLRRDRVGVVVIIRGTMDWIMIGIGFVAFLLYYLCSSEIPGDPFFTLAMP